MSDPTGQQTDRIEQFRKMAADDPENELAHLSLGRELLNAGRPMDAAESFRRSLELNEKISKAYELLGKALLEMERKADAAVVLKRGVEVAAERGDRMPREAMELQLRDLGEEVPDVQTTRRVEVGEGQVLDARTGEPGARLPRRPMKGVLGETIYENVSAESWREWIGMGTKVINELRLPMSDPRARQTYDDHMIDFLNIREAYEAKKAGQTTA